MVIQEMTRSECQSALAGTRLGSLACAHENQPYVVPIYFVYEEPYLCGFTTPDQKVEWMRSNPLVCVELDEVDDRNQWTSVVVFGRYEELPDSPEGEPVRQHVQGPARRTALPARTHFADQERLHAHELLRRHAGWWEPGCASCARRGPDEPTTPVFYRIRIDRITGRRAMPRPSGPSHSSIRPAAQNSQNWLRCVFHTLARALTVRRGVKRLE